MIIKENCKDYISHLTWLKKDFRYRESVNYTEIVKSNGEKVISTKNNQFAKGLYLFSMVKRDILRYIKENGYITPYDQLPVNHKNKEYDKKNKYWGW